MQIEERFVFSGHGIGASAHFDRLDDVHNLDHAIPTLGSAVLPQVGGLSHHLVNNFSYTVKEPRRRTLLSAQQVESTTRGTERDDHYETEVEVLVRGVSVLDKFHVDHVELKQRATRAKDAQTSLIRTTVAIIDGLQLGNVTARVELDIEPFETCCTKQELLDFIGKHNESAWRFAEIKGRLYGTLVKKIELEGPDEELAAMTVNENTIKWDGFGTIYLGEVIVRDEDRQVSLIRLRMGSDSGGKATIGGGATNGGTVP